MKIKKQDNYIIVDGIDDFDPYHTFMCGQCFRWNQSHDGSFVGVAYDKVCKVICHENKLRLTTNLEDFNAIWCKYLDLDRDYRAIRNDFVIDDFTKNACEFGKGIKILCQDPWEALCSFIISQCNNIPRIKSIIETLCKNWGKELHFEGNIYYSFPSVANIASLSIDHLSVLKCGYRAPYILSAAQNILSGEIDFQSLSSMTTSDARKAIMRQKGIGSKVADCFLLFGLCKYDAFPVDTWIKKAKSFYAGDINYLTSSQYAGMFQQYIFYYARQNKLSS